jgi:hypothetical protein
MVHVNATMERCATKFRQIPTDYLLNEELSLLVHASLGILMSSEVLLSVEHTVRGSVDILMSSEVLVSVE